MKVSETLIVGTDFRGIATLANEALAVFERDELLDCALDFVCAVYDYRSSWNEISREERKALESEIAAQGLEVHKLLHSLLQKAQSVTSAGKTWRSVEEALASELSQLASFVVIGKKYLHWIRICIRDYYGTDINDPFMNGLVPFLRRFQMKLQRFR